MRFIGWVALVLLSSACAGARARPTLTGETPLREEVVRSARDRLGQRTLTLRGQVLVGDCLALPRAALGEHGLDLGPGTAESLYARLRHAGRLHAQGAPRPGDLVFIREGHLAGRPHPEGALHVGLIGRVDPDGTLLVYQRLARGVSAYRMNPAHPHDARLGPGRPISNDSLSAGEGDLAPAGALFSGYASVLP